MKFFRAFPIVGPMFQNKILQDKKKIDLVFHAPIAASVSGLFM